MKRLLTLSILLLTALVALQAQGSATSRPVESTPPTTLTLDELPKFKGGDMQKFREWIYSKVSLSKDQVRRGLSGKVVVSFVINKDGQLSEVAVVESPNEELSKAVVDAVKRSPRWTPAKMKGEAVRYKGMIPVIFNLSR